MMSEKTSAIVAVLAVCVGLVLAFATGSTHAQEIQVLDCNGRGTLVNNTHCDCINAQPNATNTAGFVGINCEIPVTYLAKDTSSGYERTMPMRNLHLLWMSMSMSMSNWPACTQHGTESDRDMRGPAYFAANIHKDVADEMS